MQNSSFRIFQAIPRHHAIPRDIPRHHAIPRDITRYHAIPRDIARHHAIPGDIDHMNERLLAIAGPRETIEPGEAVSFTEEWHLLPMEFPASYINENDAFSTGLQQKNDHVQPPRSSHHSLICTEVSDESLF